MKKKIFILTVIVVIIVCFILFQNNNKTVETTGYEIKEITYRDIISSIGSVEYESKVEIKAEVSGTILDIYKESGDKMSKGELLAKIDNNEALLEYKDIINKIASAKAKYNDYMYDYYKNVQSIKDQRLIQEKEIETIKFKKSQLLEKIVEAKELLSERAIPEKDLLELNEEMALLDLNIKTADAKLESLRLPVATAEEINASINAAEESKNKQEKELAKYSVKAPLDGIVINNMVEPGSFVQVGQVIFETASDKEKYAVVEIDEKFINKVSAGKEAQIYMEAYPEKISRGVIEKISPEVHKENGTIKIKVKINENKEMFIGNMAVKVDFVSESYENAIVIPGEYLVNDDKSTVYIKNDNGLAVKKEVEVFNKNTNNVMILKGLRAGDVILNPVNLKEGVNVNVTFYNESENGL